MKLVRSTNNKRYLDANERLETLKSSNCIAIMNSVPKWSIILGSYNITKTQSD